MKNRIAKLLSTLPAPKRGRLKPLHLAQPATLRTLRLESMALLVDAAVTAASLDSVLRLPDDEENVLLRVVRAHYGYGHDRVRPVEAQAFRGTADTFAVSRKLFVRLSQRLAGHRRADLALQADIFMGAWEGGSPPRGWTRDQADAARALLIAGGIDAAGLEVEVLSSAHATARLVWTGARELVDWHRPVVLAVLHARAIVELQSRSVGAIRSQTRPVLDRPPTDVRNGTDSTGGTTP